MKKYKTEFSREELHAVLHANDNEAAATIISIVAALIYLLSPIDMIPDIASEEFRKWFQEDFHIGWISDAS